LDNQIVQSKISCQTEIILQPKTKICSDIFIFKDNVEDQLNGRGRHQNSQEFKVKYEKFYS